MIIKGEVKSVSVKNKLDSNDKEIMVMDLRVEVMEGQRNAQEFLELIKKHVAVDIAKVQLSFDTADTVGDDVALDDEEDAK